MSLGVPATIRSSIILVRTDGEGLALWETQLDSQQRREVRSVVEAADGGFVATGVTAEGSLEEADLFILKVDSRGGFLWESREGGPARQSGHAVAEAAGGDLLVTGSAYGQDGNSDVLLLRTDATGGVRWRKTFGGRDSDSGRALLETADGGVVVAGSSSNSNGNSALYLLKTDREGNLAWEHRLGGGWSSWAESVARTRDGGLLLAGWMYGRGEGGGDLYLVRTDGEGNVLWDRTFGGAFDDWGWDAVETTTGDVVAVGGTVSFSVGEWPPRLYLVKVDSQGEKVWDQVYGEESSGAGVGEAIDGGYLVGGTLMLPEPGSRIYLLKRTPGTAEEGRFTRGDANRDHAVDVSDAVTVIDGLFFVEQPFPFCPDGADADDNGTLEITDAVLLLGFLFLDGPPPSPPFPEAGSDPTPDAL